MASFRVLYGDGSKASNTEVSVMVDGLISGGYASGYTDSDGWVSIPTSGNTGKVYVNGTCVHEGSLNISEIRVR